VTQPLALVIGGSVGGLFAANLLRTIGWDALVFERTTGGLGDRGTGIGTREELFTVMRRIGVPMDATIGVQVRGRIGLDREGRTAHELPVPGVTSAWPRIWHPLKETLPAACYRGGMTLTSVEQDAHGVTAQFSDGTRQSGELLIAADGIHSTVRTQLLPQLKPLYAGYVGWRGVVDEHLLDPALGDAMFDHMIFGFPNGELMLSIPMPGPEDGPHRGERRCHFIWFRPVPENVLPDLCTDATGRQHGTSIPPPLIRPELLEDIKRDADALLAPQLAALVKGTEQIILQPIFDLESPRLVFGRVVLLGDAAFVARPHVASGVMKAALDAERLTDALSGAGDLGTVLVNYERERRMFGQWLVARGRHIGSYFEARNVDPRQRIETVLREYGAAGVVHNEPITVRKFG
jgi:2-polyprenyl-6-methoxyphenol hydroxylase-like FAD-dependent oxidoreductase